MAIYFFKSARSSLAGCSQRTSRHLVLCWARVAACVCLHFVTSALPFARLFLLACSAFDTLANYRAPIERRSKDDPSCTLYRLNVYYPFTTTRVLWHQYTRIPFQHQQQLTETSQSNDKPEDKPHSIHAILYSGVPSLDHSACAKVLLTVFYLVMEITLLEMSPFTNSLIISISDWPRTIFCLLGK